MTRIERLQQEVKLVEAQYGELELGPNLEWFVIKRWKLVSGWNKAETKVLVMIPAGYAVTPPDNFYTDNDLRLAGRSQPGNTSADQNLIGRQWLQFSFHFVEPGDWQPHADPLKGHNLLTFLQGVAKRLSEVS